MVSVGTQRGGGHLHRRRSRSIIAEAANFRRQQQQQQQQQQHQPGCHEEMQRRAGCARKAPADVKKRWFREFVFGVVVYLTSQAESASQRNALRAVVLNLQRLGVQKSVHVLTRLKEQVLKIFGADVCRQAFHSSLTQVKLLMLSHQQQEHQRQSRHGCREAQHAEPCSQEEQQQEEGGAVFGTGNDGEEEQAAEGKAHQCRTCPICLETAHQPYVLVPCGHGPFHASCADRISKGSHRCPVCRDHVVSSLRVFL